MQFGVEERYKIAILATIRQLNGAKFYYCGHVAQIIGSSLLGRAMAMESLLMNDLDPKGRPPVFSEQDI